MENENELTTFTLWQISTFSGSKKNEDAGVTPQVGIIFLNVL